MKKIYGICSGEYSDWHIDYMFQSEEKRNKILDKLNEGDNSDNYKYDKIDYELKDDDFNLNNIENFYYVDCDLDNYFGYFDFYFEIKKGNTLKNNISDFNYIDFYNYDTTNTYNLTLKRIISKNDLVNKENLENKFKKICQDYFYKGKYFVEVEGINIYEVATRLEKIEA
ncbi:hypothetical protein [Clostridium botulinum]|uniref:hypothetical protein n=1 Tax=Clostridium botulinum TaxID=1491 RepID=UPI00174AFCE7|nr:hypothetical protein [Clostridium botulinum]MBD5589257.1 hypothetical protein [Clostridium botulinum]